MTKTQTQLPDADNPHAAEFAVLEALKAEVESLKDQRLRALAEVENVRRRAEKEKTDASQYAVTKFARDMVGIADNFARALAAVPAEVRDAADPQVKAVLDGVEATDRQLIADPGALWRQGRWTPATASSIPTCIRPSPKCPASGKPPGSIVDVVQSGFMIGERLLRPAMVTVAKKDMPAEAAGVDTKV